MNTTRPTHLTHDMTPDQVMGLLERETLREFGPSVLPGLMLCRMLPKLFPDMFPELATPPADSATTPNPDQSRSEKS
jgi:hypothetical protein